MRLGILTCRWKRPEVFELFATGLRRLQDTFGIIPLVVGEDKSYCGGFNYIEYPNDPLGRKWNAGMQAMRFLKPDYVMLMGSDDFISDDTMRYILDCCALGFDVIGMRDCYFYDAPKDRLGYWAGFTAKHRIGESMGLCRTISRSVLDQMNWQPWLGKANAGLDWLMTQKLNRIKHTEHIFSLREQGLFAVDYKTKDNICAFNLYDTEIVDSKLLKQIPEL